jgi:predicted nucleic acid-binding protein
MPGEIFVDTNILVYAHDMEAGPKHQKAKDLVAEGWHHCPPPWVSIQVLQELLVNLRRKGVGPKDARHTVEDYMQWRVVENTLSLLADGLDEMERWQISLWDAMILAAARYAGARIVWSEDLSEDQNYDGIEIVNPLNHG